MTDARHTGADVQTLTDSLIAQANNAGGQLVAAELAREVEAVGLTPTQAKKILRALSEAGVTVVVDGSGSTRRKVSAARSGSPASKTTTAKTTIKKTAAASKVTTSSTKTSSAAGDAGSDSSEDTPKKVTARKAAGTTAKKAAVSKATAKAQESPEGGSSPTVRKAAAAKKADAKGEEPTLGIEDEETPTTDFEWDDEETEALKQARKDAEMTASADSVRAYLKQIGKVPLLNAEQEVELA